AYGTDGGPPTPTPEARLLPWKPGFFVRAGGSEARLRSQKPGFEGSDEDLAGPLAAAGPADGADPPVVRLGVALRADLGEPLVHRGLAPPAVVERVALALGRLGVLAGGLVGGEPGGQVAAQDVHPADVLGGELLGVLAVEGLEPLQALLGLRADVGGVAGGDDQLAELLGLLRNDDAGHGDVLGAGARSVRPERSSYPISPAPASRIAGVRRRRRRTGDGIARSRPSAGVFSPKGWEPSARGSAP